MNIIPQSWQNKIQQHPLWVVFIVFGIVFSATEGVKKIRYAEQLIEEITKAGIQNPSITGEFQLKLWYANVIFFLVVLLLFAGILYVGSRFKIKNIQTYESARAKLVWKTLDGMMAASLRIRNQLIAVNEQPKIQLQRVNITYTIRKNRDVNVVKEYEIKTIDADLHFWEFPLKVDELADEVELLDSLDFHVSSTNGCDVVYLPTKDQKRSKEVVIYFLPKIKTTDPDSRKLKIEYKWPGLANALTSKRRDNWSWDLESHGIIPEVKITFLYEELGAIEHKTVGDVRGNQIVKDLDKSNTGFNGFEYIVNEAPSGKYVLELRLK